ncbi:bifunctional hydroxymethylpyrimidine kinase/phosphomethylpyrimidine kinase [Pontibacter qinzhouensis]|uniref:hydroxymethylpyrimidine kinase n=1 Tax=Pontibacter qinzhouensis TaxID=2603253 RepID=A0A5C8KBW4_9BACT|nr:bifunctional hydroxymethylpyrimidine kinase/phosphomethylpyrimidine kinase [Pontibacter qinzhouensis]TXK48050.1 bifunctional hydroxymethylpyrimidine kinase/phosphomethylpyrimidine kinase [Pontibacter qinzhouensis]
MPDQIERYKYPAVLTIAGSDSGGGAGIQADLKTFSALGCFGTSAITAITVQNTLGVTGIHGVPPAIVQQQVQVVLDDIKPTAVKIGMVHSVELVQAIVAALQPYPDLPVVLDPVMVATSGDKLIHDQTIEVLKQKLFPMAEVVTPNIDEAAILAQMPISSLDDMKIAARKILQTGCQSVLLKGGHLEGPRLYDVFVQQDGQEHIFESDNIVTRNTHGTGCTLSSAIAAYRAQGQPLLQAIREAKLYVHQAILQGKDVKTGAGHGPLNHFFEPLKLQKHELE